jgi:hypothetical protein
MIALIGSLLGLFTSFMPEVFKLVQNKRDQAHELAVLKLQIEAAAKGHLQKMEEIGLQADVAEAQVLHKRGVTNSGVTWIDGLNASVRPVLAYSFFFLYVGVKAVFVLRDLPWHLWTEFDDAIFASVISYYFGARSLSKVMGRK